MSLPRPALATGSATIGGVEVPLTALTFAQARELRDLGEAARVAHMIACATGLTREEAEEWIAAVSVETGADLLLAITALSGLEEQVTVATGAGPKASRARKPTNANS